MDTAIILTFVGTISAGVLLDACVDSHWSADVVTPAICGAVVTLCVVGLIALARAA